MKIKRVIKVICLCLCMLSIQSCLATALYEKSKSNITKSSGYLELEIFQVISDYEALAKTETGDIVKVETTIEPYYDSKKLSGNFIRIGTYSYPTLMGIQKTVPVFVKMKEYIKVKNEQSYWILPNKPLNTTYYEKDYCFANNPCSMLLLFL